MKKGKTKNKPSFGMRALNGIERAGNKLPHPITLFVILSLAIVLISALCVVLGVSATAELADPASGKLVSQTFNAVSLLNKEGITYMITHAVSNFTSFAPLGVVLVGMLGVGIAESSGYISAFLVNVAHKTPKSLLTPMVIFLGVMSNIASDVGYVIIIPLGGILFLAFKRHPLAGIAATFAGVSGGFSANLIIGTLDPMLAAISSEAAAIIEPGYIVNATDNWFFMFVSTFVIVAVGTFITSKVVEPRLDTYHGTEKLEAEQLSAKDKKSLRWANWGALIYIALVAIACIPANSFFRNPETGSLIKGAPLITGIIVVIALLFFIPGVIFGLVSGKYSGEKDIAVQMGENMGSMGSYIALSFFAAQFINYFAYTNLGTILAVNGSLALEASGISGPLLMVLFVLFVAFINIFMGSASAKWTILAPIFVPMFMLLGYSPALTQVAYRIGDSCTNLITPLMAYFAMVVVFMKKYDKDAGLGTLIATMLPYSLAFLVSWIIMMVIWMVAGLPLGPGAGLVY